MTINLSWPSKDPLTPCGQAKSIAVQLLLLSAQVGGRIIRKLATTMLQEGIPDDVYIQSSQVSTPCSSCAYSKKVTIELAVLPAASGAVAVLEASREALSRRVENLVKCKNEFQELARCL